MLVVSIIILAFTVAYLGIAFGRGVGLVDVPDARKLHDGAIPLTGGITVFLPDGDFLLGGFFAIKRYDTGGMR